MKYIRTLLVIKMILVVVALLYMLIHSTATDYNTVAKDDKSLYVGTYKVSTNTDGVKYYNRYYINIYDKAELVETIEVLTNDKELVVFEELDNMVFYDVSSIIGKYTNNYGIKYWHLLDPTNNYITVSTEWTSIPLLSAPTLINDSGIYVVNIPTYNGEKVQVEHNYVYKENVIKWR